MTDTPFIPDYLKPALERLAAARAAHLEQARRMEDTLTAISARRSRKRSWSRTTAATPAHGVLLSVPGGPR